MEGAVEIGKTYVGEFNDRRRVVAIEGDDLTFVYPISLERETVPLAEFEAWAVGEYVDPFAA